MRNKSLICLAALFTVALAARAGALDGVQVSLTKLAAPVSATPRSSGNNQLLYFTSNSFTADRKHLVFLSDRTGSPNIFVRDMETGKERQLTSNNLGTLKSYVYFDGTPYVGLSKASISLDPHLGLIYYIQGKQIRVVNLQGQEHVLAELPSDQMTAFTHVSTDGKRLCVPTTDAEALDGSKQLNGKPAYDIDALVQAKNLSSYLRVYDTRTGKEIVTERISKAWVTHVQFSPIDSNLILYNHEWPSDCGIRRMWLWNGKEHLQLRREVNGGSRKDWVSHEMWERDGKGIIYHGRYSKGASFIGRVSLEGLASVEIPLPSKWKGYGHFTVGNEGTLVTDGGYELLDNETPKWGGAWISVAKVNWISGSVKWFPICKHGSTWASQDSHPHPILDANDKMIFFNSNISGNISVYAVPVKEETVSHKDNSTITN